MKYQCMVLAAFLCLFSQVNAQKLKNTADSANFFIGYLYGKQLLDSGLELKLNIMNKGIQGAIDKKEIAVSEISEFLQKYLETQQGKIKAKTLKEGEAFLAKNGENPGVVTLPSGLQYKIIKEGTGRKPKKTDHVSVLYHGTLIDGTVVDSSKERQEPANLPVDGTIAGFTEALLLMNEGSVWEIYIPSALGYGDRGNIDYNGDGSIKPNSALIFEIDLLKVAPEEEQEE